MRGSLAHPRRRPHAIWAPAYDEGPASRRRGLRACSGAGRDQALRIAETSNSSLTFSETSTPPVSSAAFQVRPQSLRLIVVPPSKPMRRLPKGSRAEPVGSNTTVTGLVSPLIERLPVTTQSSPSRSTLVEEKTISLLLSASKKSAERR